MFEYQITREDFIRIILIVEVWDCLININDEVLANTSSSDKFLPELLKYIFYSINVWYILYIFVKVNFGSFVVEVVRSYSILCLIPYHEILILQFLRPLQFCQIFELHFCRCKHSLLHPRLDTLGLAVGIDLLVFEERVKVVVLAHQLLEDKFLAVVFFIGMVDLPVEEQVRFAA